MKLSISNSSQIRHCGIGGFSPSQQILKRDSRVDFRNHTDPTSIRFNGIGGLMSFLSGTKTCGLTRYIRTLPPTYLDTMRTFVPIFKCCRSIPGFVVIGGNLPVLFPGLDAVSCPSPADGINYYHIHVEKMNIYCSGRDPSSTVLRVQR